MANINLNELTNEQVAKAMACETAEELMAAAKEEGFLRLYRRRLEIILVGRETA